MEISSSSCSPELKGLEKDDDEDEEEIFDSSGKGKQKFISWESFWQK